MNTSNTKPIQVQQHPRGALDMRGPFWNDDRASHGCEMDAPCWIPTGAAKSYCYPPVERTYDIAHKLRKGA